MPNPPPGYDDESVIHKSQLKNLLGDFEGELEKIQALYDTNRAEVRISKPLEESFWAFKNASLELGSDYTSMMDQLIEDYNAFTHHPDQESLSKIYASIKTLQLELAAR
jgi:hypothetical protein